MKEAFSEIFGALLGLAALAIALVLGTGFLLVLYGVAVLVFRHAFGVELPNPFDWLPPDWRQRFGFG